MGTHLKISSWNVWNLTKTNTIVFQFELCLHNPTLLSKIITLLMYFRYTYRYTKISRHIKQIRLLIIPPNVRMLLSFYHCVTLFTLWYQLFINLCIKNIDGFKWLILYLWMILNSIISQSFKIRIEWNDTSLSYKFA